MQKLKTSTPADKPRLGRPPTPANLQQRRCLSVHLTDDEAAVVASAARMATSPRSHWARRVLVDAARAVLRAAGLGADAL